MNCPRCSTPLPSGAAFCHACGTDPVHGDDRGDGRRHSYAVAPGQSVWSFDVVSPLMPLASERTPQTYRFALLAGAAVPAIAVMLGWLPFAFAAAALLVPTVYLVYLYDVNEWEDQPVAVLGGTIALAAVLSLGFTLLWHGALLPDDSLSSSRTGTWSIGTFLVICVVVPVIGEALRQIGPVVLSRRPAFDDLIDSVTFAVASGATWAAVETLVVNRSLLLDGPGSLDQVDAAHWWMLLITAGIVKPIVFGSATAIALAGFSGVGAGYRGFGPHHLRGTAEAVAAVALYSVGQYTADRVDGTVGSALGLLTALAVAAVVVLRVRLVLHTALMESALEAALTGGEGQHAAHGTAYCGNCDMPLLPGAAFCSACGTSTRAVPKARRAFNEQSDTDVAAPGDATSAEII